MERRWGVLILRTSLALVLVAFGVVPDGSGGTGSAWSAQTNDYAATIEGQMTSTSAGDAGDDGGSSAGGPTSSQPAPSARTGPGCQDSSPGGTCGHTAPDASGAGPSTVTVSDIAHFVPSTPVQRIQPRGWAVINLPSNIYAESATHTIAGTLLGQSARVRFTPVAFHWDYGDGTTARHAVSGGSWEALRLREFDETPTSHTYRTAGDYTISLTVEFRAEYSIANSPFLPIVGTVRAPADPLHIVATRIKTVLVHADCHALPTGPGC